MTERKTFQHGDIAYLRRQTLLDSFDANNRVVDYQVIGHSAYSSLAEITPAYAVTSLSLITHMPEVRSQYINAVSDCDIAEPIAKYDKASARCCSVNQDGE